MSGTNIFDRIMGFLAALAGSLYILAVLLVCTEVGARYWFSLGMGWVIEVSEYILLYSCFLGAAWVLKEEGHVRMDLLAGEGNYTLRIITSIISVIVCTVFVWLTAHSTWDRFVAGAYFDQVLRWPRVTVYFIMPVGFFLLLIQFLRMTRGFVESLRERKTHLKGE